MRTRGLNRAYSVPTRIGYGLLLSLTVTMSGMACSSSSSPGLQGGDGGAADDGEAIAYCGATEDCVAEGLKNYTCVYPAAVVGCGVEGECKQIVAPADVSNCTPMMLVCPCSGTTQVIAACMQGYSPVAVGSLGACPPDPSDDASFDVTLTPPSDAEVGAEAEVDGGSTEGGASSTGDATVDAGLVDARVTAADAAGDTGFADGGAAGADAGSRDGATDAALGPGG